VKKRDTILGVLLIAASFGYLADSVTPLLLPSYADIVGRIASIPLTLGEPVIILAFDSGRKGSTIIGASMN